MPLPEEARDSHVEILGLLRVAAEKLRSRDGDGSQLCLELPPFLWVPLSTLYLLCPVAPLT
jgi:hypothetical protein